MTSVQIQIASTAEGIPADDQVKNWAKFVIRHLDPDAEVVIRIVDEDESAKLNKAYRHRDGPTNVLSFPLEIPKEVSLRLLGDLVICVPVVIREAREQAKSFEAHFAHMVVHGILHLLGFDHISAQQANTMEREEIKILKVMGFSNPYEQVTLL